MANPTTNFGWVMPTSSSLVTNLPADFNTFGQGVDTSLQYLLGGTTGQVLSKTSGTNMAFTWVTPTDQTPLTTKGDLFAFSTVDARLAVGANETRLVADSTQTVGLKYVADTTNYAIAAKGDLLAGTAADTLQALTVGNNGETLVADSSATTGLRYQGSQAAGKNYTINGGFDFWQRATSATFTPTNSTPQYNSVDRFWFAGYGTTGSCTASRQTADTTNLNYGLRFGRASGTTQTAALYVGTNIESQQMKLLAGKAIVLSFYAKKGADFSYTPTVKLYSGTGTDQAPITLFNGTWTGGADVVNTTFSPTTTMTRYTFTGTVPTTSNELSFYINWTPSGTAGGNEWLQIEGVQLEIGSVATEFQRSGGTLQGELAACQRYYIRTSSATLAKSYLRYASGLAASTTISQQFWPLPVPMRVSPTSLETNTISQYVVYDGSGSTTLTGMSLDGDSGNQFINLYCTVASGLTQFRPYFLTSNGNQTSYIGLSAEL
jgi:hypothetical protein